MKTITKGLFFALLLCLCLAGCGKTQSAASSHDSAAPGDYRADLDGIVAEPETKKTPADKPSLPQQIGKTGKDIANGVGEAGKDVLRDVGEAGKDVANGIGDAAKDTADGVGGAAKDLTKGLGDAAKSLSEGVGDAAARAKAEVS